MISLTLFERDVMERLLADPREPIATLRKQYAAAVVTKRELTGAGFFLYFQVPENIERVPNSPSMKFGDVTAAIDGLKFGAGFVLYVKDGRLDMLEGYSYEEPWPVEILHYTLSVDPGLAEKKESLLRQIIRS